MVVTMGLSIAESTLTGSLEASRRAAGKVQADWACFGGVNSAAMNPPDSFARYDYYGTRVQVTVHDPPLSVLEDLLESAGEVLPASRETGQPVRMYCAVAASPTLESSSDATWYFIVNESKPPKIWASWPGLERSQPYR